MTLKQTKEEEIQKIVQISGISRSTIFRYLAGKKIRPSSLQCIEDAVQIIRNNKDAAEDKGKHQHVAQKTREIIVSINSSTFDQFQGNSEALSGIIEESGEHDVHIQLAKSMETDKMGCGVIILGKHDPEEDDECEFLRSKSIPFVVINRVIEYKNISYVASDIEACAYDVCCHLIEQGCTKILFWGEQQTKVSRSKLKGYKRALLSANIDYNPLLVFTDETPLECIFDQFHIMHPVPDAFMAMDDETATVAIRLAIERGFSVPKDIAISGMNDIGSSKNIIPSLTSVKIPFRKLGVFALRALLQKIDDPDTAAVKIIVNHKLIIRDSTRKLP